MTATHAIRDHVRERRINKPEDKRDRGRLVSRLGTFLPVVVAAIAGLGILGCETDSSQPSGGQASTPPASAQIGEMHEHASEGPHGGTLIELGNDAYHAELVHDDASGTVTVYVLDSAASAAVPIDAPSVTINLTHDGQGEQFTLAASADANDPPGQSSRFVSNDAELAAGLDHEGAAAQLVLMIEGIQYRGAIGHRHE